MSAVLICDVTKRQITLERGEFGVFHWLAYVSFRIVSITLWSVLGDNLRKMFGYFEILPSKESILLSGFILVVKSAVKGQILTTLFIPNLHLNFVIQNSQLLQIFPQLFRWFVVGFVIFSLVRKNIKRRSEGSWSSINISPILKRENHPNIWFYSNCIIYGGRF